MFTTETYINSLKENLQKNADKLIGNIKETINFNYFNEIDLLDFCVYIQPFELAVMMFSMDREANEVFYEGDDNSIFAGSYELLGDIVYYNLSDDESDDFWEFYEQNDEVLSNAETQAVMEWFITCWDRAKGKNLKLPAYFCFHDDVKSFDLHKNKWISDEEKWSE
ncbi:hypothetical protein ACQKMN_15665 [Ureibacillus composti]